MWWDGRWLKGSFSSVGSLSMLAEDPLDERIHSRVVASPTCDAVLASAGPVNSDFTILGVVLSNARHDSMAALSSDQSRNFSSWE